MEGHIVYPARRLMYGLVFCGVLSAGIAFTLLNKSVLAGHLHAWKLLPRPERLTELYFADHEHLPVTLGLADKQTVNFVVNNLEHETVDYTYTIFARSGANGQEAALDTGHVKLDHAASQTITRTITPPQLGRRLAIGVRLAHDEPSVGGDTAKPKTQSIHYWVTVPGKAAKTGP